MSDIKRPQAPTAGSATIAAPAPAPAPAPEPNRAINPANSFHSGPKPAAKGVLDLRQVTVAPPAEPLAPIPVPSKPSETEVQLKPVTSVPVSPTEVTTVPTTLPTPVATPIVSVEKSDLIKKFVRPAIATPQPAPPPQIALPNQVATQMESMQRLIPATSAVSPPAADHKPAFAPASGSAASIKSIMAATAAVAIMGGYIWLSNYNTLTVKAAGKKAGIQASLPGYVPSSYSLSGPIAYSAGVVSLQFKSPSVPGALTITQTKSDWNSAALLQLYVNNRSTSYVSVENQGLTIYLYNGNQVAFVNKGIKYDIVGDTHLSRDQVLKIAESL